MTTPRSERSSAGRSGKSMTVAWVLSHRRPFPARGCERDRSLHQEALEDAGPQDYAGGVPPLLPRVSEQPPCPGAARLRSSSHSQGVLPDRGGLPRRNLPIPSAVPGGRESHPGCDQAACSGYGARGCSAHRKQIVRDHITGSRIYLAVRPPHTGPNLYENNG